MDQTIKKHFSGHVHQNIIKKIVKDLPEEEQAIFLSFAVQCYKKYRDHKTIMRNNDIQMENFFDKSHRDHKKYSKKNFEYFIDAVEKTIIRQESEVIEHRIKTKQSEHLFNPYTRQIIEDLVVAKFSKFDIQESIGKKINSFSDSNDFANALYNLLEQNVNWSKDYYLKLIKNSDLKDNVDYIIRHEDDNTLNIEIISYEASKLLGARMWCLVREYMHFEDYRRHSKQFLVFSYDFNKSFSELNSIVATLFDCNLNVVESYLKNDEIWDEYSDVTGFECFEKELQKKVFPDKANWTNAFIKALNDPMLKHEISESCDYDFHSNAFLENIFSNFSFCLEPIPEEVFNHELIKCDFEIKDKELTIYDLHIKNKEVKSDLTDTYEYFFFDRIDHNLSLSEEDKTKLFSWLQLDEAYNKNGLHIRFLHNAVSHEQLSLAKTILFQNFNELKKEFNAGIKPHLFKNAFKLMINESFEEYEIFMTQFLNLYDNEDKHAILTNTIEILESSKSKHEKSMYFNFVKKGAITKIDLNHVNNNDEVFKHFMLNSEDMIDIFKINSKDDLFCLYDILFTKVLDGNIPRRKLKTSKNKVFTINKSDLISSNYFSGTNGIGYSFLFGINFTNSLINGSLENCLKTIKENVSEELFYSSLREYFIMEKNILFNFVKLGLRIAEEEKCFLVIKKAIGFYKMLEIPYNLSEISEQVLGLEDRNKIDRKTFLLSEKGILPGEIDYKKTAKKILKNEFTFINI